MDAEYLRENVGSSLAQGLAEVAAIRPSDPIEYLALWLLKHKENLLQRERVRFKQQMIVQMIFVSFSGSENDDGA